MKKNAAKQDLLKLKNSTKLPREGCQVQRRARGEETHPQGGLSTKNAAKIDCCPATKTLHKQRSKHQKRSQKVGGEITFIGYTRKRQKQQGVVHQKAVKTALLS